MTDSTMRNSWGLMMARRKQITGSGKLHRGKLPARVMECVCSWDMTPRALADELQIDIRKVWRTLACLRTAKFIEDRKPATWNKIVIPTPAGRAALAEYTARIHNAKT